MLEYLPTHAPFYSCTADDTALVPKGSSSITTQAITNSDLLSLMKNKSAFYDHYIRLTNKAIDLYVKAGRRKFALKLHSRLASLDAYVADLYLILNATSILKWKPIGSEEETFPLCRHIRPYQHITARIVGVTLKHTH